MRIELDVDLGRRSEPPPAHDDATRAEQRHLARQGRHLRRIALAQHIDHLVDSGVVASYAEIARMCQVSRAAVSKVVGALGQQLPTADNHPSTRPTA